MTDVTPPPAPPSTPVWEDLLDIFVSPSAVFQRRKDDPTFFVPLLIITVVFAVLIFFAFDIFEPVSRADSQRQIETMLRNNPNMPAETVERVRAQAAAGGGMARYFLGLLIPVSVLFVGLYVWIAGKAVGAKTSMGQAYMITAYAYAPKIIGVLISIVLMLVLPEAMLDGQSRLGIGAGLFLDPDTTSPVLMVLLARVELTVLWLTALIALGLRVTGGLTWGKAAAAGILVWILGALLPVGGVLLGQMAQGAAQ